MHALTTLYADYQRQRGLAPNTVERRSTSLRMFARFAAPTTIADATPPLIDDFLGMYPSAATRRAYRGDLVCFYRWAHRRQLVAVNPTDLVDPIRVPKSLPRPVATEQIPAIIAAAEPQTALMLALAAYAGLRRFELAQLDRDDCDIWRTPPVIVVRNGKGGKDRIVPAHPVLVAMLQQLAPGPVFPVGYHRIGAQIREHLAACGVNATPHQLRHSFGTELARVTSGDLLLIARLMGHESPATTMGYIGWASGRGAEAIGGLYGDEAA
jgi:integrase/recombinase XerD